MSIITIDQQIAELKAELAHTHLTKRERREAFAELEWLKEQQRIEEEVSYFATIEREAEHPHHARQRFESLTF